MSEYVIVTSQSQRDLLESYLEEYGYIAFDTETTGLIPMKDLVIGFSVSGESGTGLYYPIYSWDKEAQDLKVLTENKEYAESFLEIIKKKELLTWNGSFDVRMVRHNFGIDLADSIIADGMLLKHMVEEEGSFGLKDVAVQIQDKIGINVEEMANEEQLILKQNVKDNGGSITKSNYEMYKADLEVLGKYACKDADLTLRVCDYYNNRLMRETLDGFFYEDENMPLYKEVTIPMEDNGVKLDIPYIQSTREEIVTDLDMLESAVISELSKLEPFKNWYWDKVNNIPENKTFFNNLCDLLKVPLPKTKTGKLSFTKKNVEALKGYGFVKEFLETGALPDIVEIKDVKEEMHLASKEAGGKRINIGSKKQLGEVVFNYMKIKPLSKTEKGNPQFNDDMIEWLEKSGHVWAEYLHQYNKLTKIKGTYIDRFLDNQIDGKYYFSYKQHGTISGRYGSDAQQLPRPMEDGQEAEIVVKYVNRIREFFVADEGRVFIDCDYDSLEPRIFAHISKDKGLIDIFENNHDFYSTVAIGTEELEGVSADKKASNYLGKVNKPLRQEAKGYALGTAYGQGAYALGKTLGISTEEAQEKIDSYLNAFPDLGIWMKESKEFAQENGYIKSEVGRVRHLPKVKEIHKRFGEKLLDFRFRKKLLRKMDMEEIRELYRDYKNGINNSRNYQVQSMAASVVNRAAIAINRRLRAAGIDGRVVAQIHDQLIVDVPEASQEEACQIVQECMENTTKLRLKLKAVPEVGKNWSEAH